MAPGLQEKPLRIHSTEVLVPESERHPKRPCKAARIPLHPACLIARSSSASRLRIRRHSHKHADHALALDESSHTSEVRGPGGRARNHLKGLRHDTKRITDGCAVARTSKVERQ
jgi:hypothetical protein